MSNIPKSKRTISEMNFYRLAFKLENKIRLVIIPSILKEKGTIKDFAGNEYNWDTEFYKFTAKSLAEDLDKNITNVIAELRFANSFYPSKDLSNNEFFKRERSKHQVNAIGYCYCILANFERYIIYFNKKADLLLSLTDEVEHLISSIKSWKKSNKKIFASEEKI